MMTTSDVSVLGPVLLVLLVWHGVKHVVQAKVTLALCLGRGDTSTALAEVTLALDR